MKDSKKKLSPVKSTIEFKNPHLGEQDAPAKKSISNLDENIEIDGLDPLTKVDLATI